MSEITTRIRAYRAGAIDLPTLVEELSERQYALPARHRDRSSDPFMLELTDPPPPEEGTWDEVRRARNKGLLTPDEYRTLSEAAWENAQQDSMHRVLTLEGLRKRVAQQAGLELPQASLAVEAVFDSIAAYLRNGDEVRLTGFGSFRVTETPERTGRNPRTGETIRIAAGRRPSFHAGKHLKQAVDA